MTAEVPPDGTPASPPTNTRARPAPSRDPPRPTRVSRTRLGTSPTYRPVQLGAADPSVNQPTTSTITSTVLGPLRRVILPSEPSPVMTRFAIVWFGLKLTFEVLAKLVPLGRTESQPAAFGAVAVRLRTTPVTPVAGTPPWPAT